MATTTGKKPKSSGNTSLSARIESPAREAAGSQEKTVALPVRVAGAPKSPRLQEVKLTADPSPAETAQRNTATDPGLFADDLPSSSPTFVSHYAPALPRSQSQEPEPPVEGSPSKATQQTDPQPLNPTARNSTDTLATSNGGKQEGRADKSAPIAIPQKGGTSFEPNPVGWNFTWSKKYVKVVVPRL